MTLEPTVEELTPRLIVQALDRYIIGQAEAKRTVAIALRNRVRRQKLPDALREEVHPKNIIMIGPTGVGKTEIARRLAKLVQAPFLKVEATKYTEVGYVGRDVESMVRDLVETSVKMVREREIELLRGEAEKRVRERLIDLLCRMPRTSETGRRKIMVGVGEHAGASIEEPETLLGRDEIARKYDHGELDSREVEIEIQMKSQMDGMLGVIGMEEQMGSIREMMEKMMPQRSKTVKMTVAEARKALGDQIVEDMLDMDKIQREALTRAEQSGIIFIDEIDKVAGRGGGHGPDVSRQGVQRDILPIVEGCTVNTKYGHLRTNHILFIAAGAFHEAKPSDLMPELQGRFPLRVELDSLSAEDFEKILTEPEHSLIEQYIALLGADGVKLTFTPDAVRELADSAAKINGRDEDIGARRLHTILERVLNQISFDAPDAVSGDIEVNRDVVRHELGDLIRDKDLSRFIL